MKTAVILSTYNSPQSLYMSLLGYTVQSNMDFELIVADDGSDERTREVLERAEFASMNIRHVWHPDDGFRKCRILNQAILETDADYLVFSDGDCIPRNDFVASHVVHARPRTFISANRVNVPREIHTGFTDDQILSNTIFDPDFLISKQRWLKKYRWRLSRNRVIQGLGDLATWRYCVLIGCNASAWRDDVVQINGFDEDFAYGSEDRDLGARLKNSGVQCRFLKFSLVLIHLDHPITTRDSDDCQRNRREFKRRWREGTTRTPNGLHPYPSVAAGSDDDRARSEN